VVPYFNLQYPGGGVDYRGRLARAWACTFTRDARGRCAHRAGQELTRCV